MGIETFEFKKIKTAQDLTDAYHSIPCNECGVPAGEKCWRANGRSRRNVPHDKRLSHGTKLYQHQEEQDPRWGSALR